MLTYQHVDTSVFGDGTFDDILDGGNVRDIADHRENLVKSKQDVYNLISIPFKVTLFQLFGCI